MHSVVLVIVPPDVPDTQAAVTTILEPYRQNDIGDGRYAWPYWDYWTLYDRNKRETTFHIHESTVVISDLNENDRFAAIFTPDGVMHDCNCPMPTEQFNEEKYDADFRRLCYPVLKQYNDHLGICVDLHT